MEALDVGADVLEFFYDLFVAAVDVVDAFDDGFALCDEGGQDQASAGTKIAGLDRRTRESCGAADYRAAMGGKPRFLPKFRQS